MSRKKVEPSEQGDLSPKMVEVVRYALKLGLQNIILMAHMDTGTRSLSGNSGEGNRMILRGLLEQEYLRAKNRLQNELESTQSTGIANRRKK